MRRFGDQLPGLLLSRPGTAFTIDSATGNTFRPFNASTDLYNFGPTNHYQRPDRRYSLGAMGHYELTEHADVYTQLMFTDYKSIAQIAPGGNFFDSTLGQLRQPAPVGAAARHASAARRSTIAAGDSRAALHRPS